MLANCTRIIESTHIVANLLAESVWYLESKQTWPRKRKISIAFYLGQKSAKSDLITV